MKPYLSLIALFLYFSETILSQDTHLSQPFTVPTLLNPALTGVIGDNYKGRVSFNYRYQDVNRYANSYNAGVLAYDMLISKCTSQTIFFGIGINGEFEKSGDVHLKTTKINMNSSLIANISENHNFSLGIKMGYVQRSFDVDAVTLGNQYDGYVYTDNALSDNVVISSVFPTKIKTLTAVGVNYFGQVNVDGLKWMSGYSINNLTNKDDASFSEYYDNLYTKHVLYARLRIPSGNDFSWSPGFVYQTQGNHLNTELLAGTDLKFIDKNFHQKNLTFGLWNRITTFRYKNDPLNSNSEDAKERALSSVIITLQYEHFKSDKKSEYDESYDWSFGFSLDVPYYGVMEFPSFELALRWRFLQTDCSKVNQINCSM